MESYGESPGKNGNQLEGVASPLQMPMSVRQRVRRWVGHTSTDDLDSLAVEEPLQIRLAGEDVTITMRTPGHDYDLAAGFLFSEGIISGKAHIEQISYCVDDEHGGAAPNIVNVLPTDRALLDPARWRRNFLASSSCGLCGKVSIDQLAAYTGESAPGPSVSLDVLYSLDATLRAAQETFAATGGLHAAALFDTAGNLIVLREDVGRHNAVDKVIGHALLNDLLPLDNHILMVSSRGSFEIVQKALVAGVTVMAVMSAPSSLAVELAREADMTLVGFLRLGRLNVYAGERRVG